MLTELYQTCPSYRDFYAPVTILICVRCPFYRGVRFMESFSVGNPTRNGRDQTKCPS